MGAPPLSDQLFHQTGQIAQGSHPRPLRHCLLDLGRDLVVVVVVEHIIRGAPRLWAPPDYWRAASPVGAARCSRSRRMAGARVRHQPTTMQHLAAPCRHAMPEIGILLPNNQRQHRTLHIQKYVLPYAWC